MTSEGISSHQHALERTNGRPLTVDDERVRPRRIVREIEAEVRELDRAAQRCQRGL
jgi:hypothetical protein